MGEYHKANLFTGRYRTGLLGRVGVHIGLPDATIRILRGHDFEDGWRETPNGAYWLVIEHGNFWPVMFRLDDEDIAALRQSLPGYVQWTYTGGETHTTIAGQRPS
jgi:hypothetical protein